MKEVYVLLNDYNPDYVRVFGTIGKLADAICEDLVDEAQYPDIVDVINGIREREADGHHVYVYVDDYGARVTKIPIE